MELVKSKTYFNLAKAFAGECMARARYEYLEYGARQQGYKALAAEIDKLAYNEFNHARMFYSFIQSATNKTINNIDISSGYPFREKWDLVENLRLAAMDEEDEGYTIYPSFAKTARDEGFDDIAGLFDNVAKVEQRHHRILTDLYRQFKDDTQYCKEKSVVWECPSCGYQAEGKEAFETCPLCQEKQGSVKLILNEQDCVPV